MKVKPSTLSYFANIVLGVWLMSIYLIRDQGGSSQAGKEGNEDVRKVGDATAFPNNANAGGGKRPTRHVNAAVGNPTAPTNDPKSYRAPLFNAQGQLTTGAAEAAGIDDNERVRIQAEIDKMRDEFEVATSLRAVSNAKLSDPTKGITVFDIPAPKDRGAGIRSDLSERLKFIVGERRARVLMDSLADTDAFGGFGAYDVRLRFFPADPKNGIGIDGVEYIATDPVTGKRTESAMMSMDMFRQYYGGTFVFDSKTDENNGK